MGLGTHSQDYGALMQQAEVWGKHTRKIPELGARAGGWGGGEVELEYRKGQDTEGCVEHSGLVHVH